MKTVNIISGPSSFERTGPVNVKKYIGSDGNIYDEPTELLNDQVIKRAETWVTEEQTQQVPFDEDTLLLTDGKNTYLIEKEIFKAKYSNDGDKRISIYQNEQILISYDLSKFQFTVGGVLLQQGDEIVNALNTL